MGVFAASKEKRRSMVAASSDGGRTFADAVDVSEDQGGIYPSLAVGPDGVVHGVYWARSFPVLPPNRPVPGIGEPGPVLPVYYVRSTDQGKTWTREPIHPGSQRDNRSPVMVADPRSSAVYMAWWRHRNPNNAAAGLNEDRESSSGPRVTGAGPGTSGGRSTMTSPRVGARITSTRESP